MDGHQGRTWTHVAWTVCGRMNTGTQGREKRATVTEERTGMPSSKATDAIGIPVLWPPSNTSPRIAHKDNATSSYTNHEGR
mmetsp:Transcript_9029/g.32075  ORF Transcript_9029/g.32075 Transcript_9029/m.32075 type:complete len:81 (-) Transcript_9029:1179-1421(-)